MARDAIPPEGGAAPRAEQRRKAFKNTHMKTAPHAPFNPPPSDPRPLSASCRQSDTRKKNEEFSVPPLLLLTCPVSPNTPVHRRDIQYLTTDIPYSLRASRRSPGHLRLQGRASSWRAARVHARHRQRVTS